MKSSGKFYQPSWQSREGLVRGSEVGLSMPHDAAPYLAWSHSRSSPCPHSSSISRWSLYRFWWQSLYQVSAIDSYNITLWCKICKAETGHICKSANKFCYIWWDLPATWSASSRGFRSPSGWRPRTWPWCWSRSSSSSKDKKESDSSPLTMAL